MGDDFLCPDIIIRTESEVAQGLSTLHYSTEVHARQQALTYIALGWVKQTHQCSIVHVKGHTGDPWNELSERVSKMLTRGILACRFCCQPLADMLFDSPYHR